MLCGIISTQSGWTALMRASYMGHVNVARTLIEARAQVNTQDEVCASGVRIAGHDHHKI